MAIGVAPVPEYLKTNPNAGIEGYLRAQQLVQQRQAQIARQEQEQAELNQRAREAAMQAQFRQQSLALKEQDQKSSVEVEANRLRLKGQELEAHNKALTQGPQSTTLPDGANVITFRGNMNVRRPGDLAGMASPTVTALRDPDDPTKVLGWDVNRGKGASSIIRPVVPKAERPVVDKAAEAEVKAQSAREREADRLDTSIALGEKRRLETQLDAYKTKFLPEEEQAAMREKLDKANQVLEGKRKAPAKAAPLKPPKQVLAEERARVANQLEREHPDWTAGEVYSESLKQVPDMK